MLLIGAGALTLRHQNGDQEIKGQKQHVKNVLSGLLMGINSSVELGVFGGITVITGKYSKK